MLSLKHTASVFQLKKDHKNLSSTEYIENLCQYLSDARNKTALTAYDLSSVLTHLIGDTNMSNADNPNESAYNPIESTDTINQLATSNNPPEDFNLDEHVAAVWMDEKENVLTWFLGVINSVSPDSVDVTYYHRKYKDCTLWTFPEDSSDPVSTPRSQIIFSEITVGYIQTRFARCSFNKETVMDIKEAFANYIDKME